MPYFNPGQNTDGYMANPNGNPGTGQHEERVKNSNTDGKVYLEWWWLFHNICAQQWGTCFDLAIFSWANPYGFSRK